MSYDKKDYQGMTIREWRYLRNLAIYYLATELNLLPGYIVSMCHPGVYCNNFTPRRKVDGKNISDRLYRVLAKLNQIPFLINARPLTQPMFTDRPQGRSLTIGWVRQIIKDMCVHKMTQTVLGMTFEQALIDDDPAVRSALNA